MISEKAKREELVIIKKEAIIKSREDAATKHPGWERKQGIWALSYIQGHVRHFGHKNPKIVFSPQNTVFGPIFLVNIHFLVYLEIRHTILNQSISAKSSDNSWIICNLHCAWDAQFDYRTGTSGLTTILHFSAIPGSWQVSRLISIFRKRFAFQGLDKFPEEETGTYVAKVWNSENG